MTLAAAGWVLIASLSGSIALLGWRATVQRRQAVVRACHELRGPLAAARLGLELGIRTGALSVERLRAIDQELGRAGLALTDLDRAAGNVHPAPERCERVAVRELLADSVRAWEPVATAAGATIELEWAGGPAFVLGDRLRLAQASGNLLANAIEHGGGAIRVTAERDRGGVRIEISDGGNGLPAPVRQLARAARRSRGGRGHGLAIASSIIEGHGGRLAAAPTDRGARLVIELPAAPEGGLMRTPAG